MAPEKATSLRRAVALLLALGAEAGERLMDVARELSMMVGGQPHDVSQPGQPMTLA
ncbi:MAG: hypothetical protein JOY58_17685 [Solirubrobacterales bacterium]|nr:hypothetical protein [Solirubrobacterales bacterium]